MSAWLGILGKVFFAAFVLNEIRGAVLAVPVLYAMYEAGGTLMAIWLGFCSLAGIGLSVVLPIYGARLARRRWGWLA